MAPRTLSMMDKHVIYPNAGYYYCYCLARGDVSLSLAGLDAIPGGLRPEARLIGGLQVIVSRVGSEDYSEEGLKARLERMEWVSDAVLDHEQVVEGCLSQTEVIPLKFCTVFRSESALESAFLGMQDELSAKLRYLVGKQEWGLRLTADRSRLRQHLEESDSRFRDLRDNFGSKSAGAVYLLRKRLEEQLERAADQSQCDVAGQAFTRLAEHATQAALVADSRIAAAGRDSLMNAAFLVTDKQLARLLEEAKRVSLEYPWLTCEKSGPWPPYNFV